MREMVFISNMPVLHCWRCMIPRGRMPKGEVKLCGGGGGGPWCLAVGGWLHRGGGKLSILHLSETTGKIKSNSGSKGWQGNNLENSLAGKLGAEKGVSSGASESSETPRSIAGWVRMVLMET